MLFLFVRKEKEEKGGGKGVMCKRRKEERGKGVMCM